MKSKITEEEALKFLAGKGYKFRNPNDTPFIFLIQNGLTGPVSVRRNAWGKKKDWPEGTKIARIIRKNLKWYPIETKTDANGDVAWNQARATRKPNKKKAVKKGGKKAWKK